MKSPEKQRLLRVTPQNALEHAFALPIRSGDLHTEPEAGEALIVAAHGAEAILTRHGGLAEQGIPDLLILSIKPSEEGLKGGRRLLHEIRSEFGEPLVAFNPLGRKRPEAVLKWRTCDVLFEKLSRDWS